jgi:DNA ligase (NAD+)
MDSQAIQAKMAQLSAQLHAHNHAYYVLNTPQISDYEFDMLLKELEALEKQYPAYIDVNSPTKRVGGDLTKKFEAKAHRFPMLSLSIVILSKKSSIGQSAVKKHSGQLPNLFVNSNMTVLP